MKTYRIELNKVTAMTLGQGLVQARIDALVLPQKPSDDGPESSVLSMSEETARLMFLLLKQQIAQIDARKGRSHR